MFRFCICKPWSVQSKQLCLIWNGWEIMKDKCLVKHSSVRDIIFPFWIFVFHSPYFFVSVVHLSDREGGFWLSAEHSRREVTPFNPQSIGMGRPTHTPLHLPLAIPLSSLPFCPPSIHLSIHWPAAPFNQTWLKRTSATPKVETVWTRLKEPLSPLPKKKKVLKFLILTKIPQWMQILFIPCPRRTTAKWNRETT